MTLLEILSDIHTIDKELAKFEDNYGVLSDTFYTWYLQGNEPEEQSWMLDFAEWAGLCKARERLLELYQKRFSILAASEHNNMNWIIQRTRQLAAAA